MQEACKAVNICSRFTADNFYGILPHHDEYTNEMLKPWINKVNACPIDMDIKIHTGIYAITDPELQISAMCDRAQLAANQNRGKYDEYFYLYDDSLREKLLEEQFITSNMHQALEQRQFHVYYQPKYDLNTEVIAGAEALVRWIHPEKGFMSPGKFIPLFEQNGFITQLDEYVWETACRDIRSWMDQGIQNISVSVNVSRSDIYNTKLIDTITGLVKKYNIPIHYLHLEITESAYTENPTQIIAVVEKLRKLGFIIEMDDFGSGYSSLNMLAEMPVDVLKLDMGFIQSETKKSSGKGILSFVISLAKWLDLAVVAEGVETKEQIVSLRSMDCNYVQGFYFAKPMEEPAFINLVKEVGITEMVCTSQTAADYVHDKAVETENIKDGKTMLIVDDIEINRAVLASCFTQKYIIEERENGETAWEFLQENFGKVQVIMLDLLMPVMDGFQLLEKIRKDKRMQDIPVIITSQGDTDSEARALKMRADDFISKPYNAEIIRHRVANVVAAYQIKMMKKGLIQSEQLTALDNFEGEQAAKLESVDEQILKQIEIMKQYFDIVRIVDPSKTLVLKKDGDTECDMQSCFSVWGKTGRCSNCISLRAFEHKTRYCKLEHSEEGLYFVVAQYVPYGEIGAVLEMVTRLNDEPIDNLLEELQWEDDRRGKQD